ncbi:MAG: T9SS type A sorting domain-containing protein [Ignavibacteria bacterium]|nr:T9SS type A sorting domain-containing protein [Ignavibacteria bacterium]
MIVTMSLYSRSFNYPILNFCFQVLNNGFILQVMKAMIKFLPTLCSILLYNGFLAGQTYYLTGIVKDKFTNDPLDSAVVKIFIKNIPSKTDSIYTNGFGNWSYTLTNVGSESNLTPEDFSLSQNYPNPFNPSTKISFSLTSSDYVKFFVHDALGQEIESFEQFLSGGNYTIDWYGAGAAGIYFYSIEFRGNRLTKKMIQLDGSKRGGFGKPYLSGSQIPFSKSYGNSINLDLIFSSFGYDNDTLSISVSTNQNIITQLVSLHHRAFVIDLHNDVLEKVVYGYELGILNNNNHSDVPRFIKGGVDAQMFALWPSPSSYPTTAFQHTMAMIDSFQRQLNKYPSKLKQAKNSKEIDSLSGTDRVVGVIAVEGGHAIENSVDKLKEFYNRGVRYMTLTWNNSTSWATAAADGQALTKGLSDFGRQVIKSMDSLGIIIDISHVGKKTIEDVLEVTTNPIIASHSGVRALRNHYRNLYDEQIVAIANSGGVIGVVFYPSFLSTSSTVRIDTVIKHIDYIKNLVGIDHVALGSDFDGIEKVVVGLEDVSKFPDLTMALLKKGYSFEDVKKILGGNFLRVFKQVCK